MKPGCCFGGLQSSSLRHAEPNAAGRGVVAQARVFAPAVVPRHEPVADAAGSRARGEVVLEVVPPVHDPEHRRRLRIGVIRRVVLTIVEGRGQDAGDLARILHVVDRRAGEDADVGVQLVVGLRPVLDVVAVTDRHVAHVAREQDAVGGVQRDPAGHRVVDRAVLDEGVVGRASHHVEVHGIVPETAALPELIELDALQLVGLEALAHHRVAAEEYSGPRRGIGWSTVSPPDTMRTLRDRRATAARVSTDLMLRSSRPIPGCAFPVSGYSSP